MFLSACNVKHNFPVCEKNGYNYGNIKGAFRNQWYDYYESGLSYIEGECYEHAIWSFEMAVKKRWADERMARAYGMHMVDYFPHRELGISFFYLKKYNDALKEIQTSIGLEPSAKAMFYLDKIRTQKLIEQKAIISKPEIVVNNADNNMNIWTNADPVVISGFAQDDQFIKKINLSGINIFIESAKKKQCFDKALKLQSGQNKLLITAENLLGGINKTNLIVNVDRTGPVIIIKKIVPDVNIEGFIYDSSEEINLIADNIPIYMHKGKKIPFNIKLSKGKKSLELIAKDKAGNKTKAIINLNISYGQKKLSSSLFAQINQPFASDAHNPVIQKPEIIIDNWSKYQSVYSNNVMLSGNVQSITNVVSLELNNLSILYEKGQNLFFSKIIPLQKGNNKVIIKAVDQSGNINIKEIVFNRKIKEIFKLKHRFGMKIYPFDQWEDSNNTEIFFDHLITGLHQQNRFRIFFSNSFQKQFYNIEPNQKISHDVSNQYFLKGIIYTASKGIEIIGRIFDINSEIIDYVDVYKEFEQTISLKDKYIFLAKQLSEKFHSSFPLITGIVENSSKKHYIITSQKWNYEKQGIRMNWPVILFRYKEPDNINNSETIIIGKSKIIRVMENSFNVEAIDKTISNGDFIIIQ